MGIDDADERPLRQPIRLNSSSFKLNESIENWDIRARDKSLVTVRYMILRSATCGVRDDQSTFLLLAAGGRNSFKSCTAIVDTMARNEV